MSLKEKTRAELEKKVNDLENLIAKKGIGSDALERAERVQRDINLALMLGAAATIVGLTAWTIYKYKGN